MTISHQARRPYLTDDAIRRVAALHKAHGVPLKAISRRSGIPYSTLRNALVRHGIPPTGPRGTRGSIHGHAKLDESSVREIRRRRASGERVRVLAREYGVTPQTIYAVINRERWAHVR